MERKERKQIRIFSIKILEIKPKVVFVSFRISSSQANKEKQKLE